MHQIVNEIGRCCIHIKIKTFVRAKDNEKDSEFSNNNNTQKTTRRQRVNGNDKRMDKNVCIDGLGRKIENDATANFYQPYHSHHQ